MGRRRREYCEKGLLEVAEDCGITKFMMDTAVTPLGQGAGIAGSATFAEKSKWGYPVGSVFATSRLLGTG